MIGSPLVDEALAGDVPWEGRVVPRLRHDALPTYLVSFSDGRYPTVLNDLCKR